MALRRGHRLQDPVPSPLCITVFRCTTTIVA